MAEYIKESALNYDTNTGVVQPAVIKAEPIATPAAPPREPAGAPLSPPTGETNG